jgi:hypothetical protein
MSFDRKHIKCILWKTLWGLAFIALILAWIGARSATGTIFTLDAGLLIYTSMILGILSIPLKLDCADCPTCGKR